MTAGAHGHAGEGLQGVTRVAPVAHLAAEALQPEAQRVAEFVVVVDHIDLSGRHVVFSSMGCVVAAMTGRAK